MARKPKYQREALLRRPHEYIASITYFVAGGTGIVASEYALTVPSIAYAGAVVCAWRGTQRWFQASLVKRYQRNLKRLPLYVMKSSQIKVSKTNQLLGKGFKWDAKHSQRIYEIELPRNDIYINQSKGFEWAREYVRVNEDVEWKKPFVKFLESQHKLNPWPPLPDLGGSPYLHSVGMYEGETDIFQKTDSRVAHTFVAGTTRVGKTRLCELQVAQDIRRGDITIVFDPKGDKDLMLRMYAECKASGREEQFYIFHLGYPEVSARYNPVGSFLRVTEVASRIANQMPGEGASLAFKEFVWGYVNQIAKTIVGIGEVPTLELIKEHSQDIEPLFKRYMGELFDDQISNWKEQVEAIRVMLMASAEDRKKAGFTMKVPNSMKDRTEEGRAYYLFFLAVKDELQLTDSQKDVTSSLIKAIQTDSSHMGKLTASLDPFLQKMTTGAVSKLINPDLSDADKDTFTWSQIIQMGGVVYIGLDALSDAEVASTVGNSMFSDLTSVAGRLYKHGRNHGLPAIKTKDGDYVPKINLHADEFNELCGKEFIPMLNKAGGAGIQVTAYTQTLQDIEAKLGSQAQADQMISNLNTKIIMRVLTPKTAGVITELQPRVTVSHYSTFSTTSDNSDIETSVDFTSSTQTREVTKEVELVRASDLANLPKGQAFAILNGNNVYKIRIPWLKDDIIDVPESLALVAEEMADKYKSSASQKWYEFKNDVDFQEILNMNEDRDVYSDFVRSMEVYSDDGYGSEGDF